MGTIPCPRSGPANPSRIIERLLAGRCRFRGSTIELLSRGRCPIRIAGTSQSSERQPTATADSGRTSFKRLRLTLDQWAGNDAGLETLRGYGTGVSGPLLLPDETIGREIRLPPRVPLHPCPEGSRAGLRAGPRSAAECAHTHRAAIELMPRGASESANTAARNSAVRPGAAT